MVVKNTGCPLVNQHSNGKPTFLRRYIFKWWISHCCVSLPECTTGCFILPGWCEPPSPCCNSNCSDHLLGSGNPNSSWPGTWVLMVDFQVKLAEPPKKKTPRILSMKYWFFHRDPGSLQWFTTIPTVFHPLYTLNLRFLFLIAQLTWKFLGVPGNFE